MLICYWELKKLLVAEINKYATLNKRIDLAIKSPKQPSD